MVLQISLLNAEHNSQLMLLGARNLTLLADVLPTICSSIVRHGAVPALCARLMTIEYIDLAEQSLQVSSQILSLPDTQDVTPEVIAEIGKPRPDRRLFSKLVAARGCLAQQIGCCNVLPCWTGHECCGNAGA